MIHGKNEFDNLDKDQTYLVYCRSDQRSGSALDIMSEINFGEVYNISDGIIAWTADGLPPTK